MNSGQLLKGPWSGEIAELAGPGSVFNMGWAAIDRHIGLGRGRWTALRWFGRNGERREFTYAELGEASSRCAGGLNALGLDRGDVVAVMMRRSPELVIAAAGALKAGGVFCPLYPSLGPDPLKARLEMSQARVLIISAELYQPAIAAIIASVPNLRAVVVAGGGETFPHCHSFAGLLGFGPANFATVETGADDPALMHFTSGTTGCPKGAIHAHKALVSQLVTARSALDVKQGDVYWCTGEPGWVASTAYGLFAPLAAGAVILLDDGPAEARRWLAILREEAVTIWYTTPTAIRMLMRLGTAYAKSFRPLSLRVAATVGEPLNAEAVGWGINALGLPIANTWWQTETGCIAVGDRPGQPVRPGAMGRPVPNLPVALVRRNADGIEEITEQSAAGELAIKGEWPSLFKDYLGEPERYRASFVDGWYLSGDLVRRDGEGFYWFLGRSDDVILTGGQMIGPFEVENTLLDHPAVSEVAVVGTPDPVAGEVVGAFVSLNPGFDPGDALAAEILAFAREHLGEDLAPRQVNFLDNLPKTRTGKILRRVLKARASGLPDGDLSTLQPVAEAG